MDADTANTTFAQVRTVIVDKLVVDPSEVTLEANLVDDLGADSLGLMDLLQGLGDELEIDESEIDTTEIHTVGDIVAAIDKILAEK